MCLRTGVCARNEDVADKGFALELLISRETERASTSIGLFLLNYDITSLLQRFPDHGGS
jgi:hypothetical protein